MTDAAVPAEPEGAYVELASGACPGLHGDPGTPCKACGDTGIVRFPAEWSAQDDAFLKEAIADGRSEFWVAQNLKPPRSAAWVYARVAVLRLREPKTAPRSKCVVVADPVRYGGLA